MPGETSETDHPGNIERTTVTSDFHATDMGVTTARDDALRPCDWTYHELSVCGCLQLFRLAPVPSF